MAMAARGDHRRIRLARTSRGGPAEDAGVRRLKEAVVFRLFAIERAPVVSDVLVGGFVSFPVRRARDG
jgi:hypothetical protein